MCIDGNKERGAEKKKRISDWTFFSTQWKLSVQAVVNITVEFSYNFNLCSLIVHVNVKLQERQNLLLAQRAKTKAQLLRRYQGESLLQNQCFFIHNFLFSKLPPLRLTGIQCCGVFRKMFIWNSSNKNMQQNHRQLFLFRHNRETIRNWPVPKQQERLFANFVTAHFSSLQVANQHVYFCFFLFFFFSIL